VTPAWRVAGTYFESCNCDPICPCRRLGGAEGGKSTHGICDFALSWWVEQRHYRDTSLDGLVTVMVGSYTDRDKWTPWQVGLLVDECASAQAQAALADIFLGRARGTPMATVRTSRTVPMWRRLWFRPRSRRRRLHLTSTARTRAFTSKPGRW
jgi:hypothetical protein